MNELARAAVYSGTTVPAATRDTGCRCIRAASCRPLTSDSRLYVCTNRFRLEQLAVVPFLCDGQAFLVRLLRSDPEE